MKTIKKPQDAHSLSPLLTGSSTVSPTGSSADSSTERNPRNVGRTDGTDILLEEGLSLSEFVDVFPGQHQEAGPQDEMAGTRSEWLEVARTLNRLLQQVSQRPMEVTIEFQLPRQVVNGDLRRLVDVQVAFDGPVDWAHCSLEGIRKRLLGLGSGVSRFPDELKITVPLAAAPATRRGTILVVDDEHCMLKVMDRVLSDTGYQVVSVLGGAEALQYAQGAGRDEIAMVFCDLVLGFDSDGTEVLAGLRDLGLSCPMVLMSGSSLLRDTRMGRTQVREGDNVVLLEKPFRVPELLSLVNQHIGNGSGPVPLCG